MQAQVDARSVVRPQWSRSSSRGCRGSMAALARPATEPCADVLEDEPFLPSEPAQIKWLDRMPALPSRTGLARHDTKMLIVGS